MPPTLDDLVAQAKQMTADSEKVDTSQDEIDYIITINRSYLMGICTKGGIEHLLAEAGFTFKITAMVGNMVLGTCTEQTGRALNKAWYDGTNYGDSPDNKFRWIVTCGPDRKVTCC